MICPGNLERIAKYSGRIVIIVPGRVPVAPGRERFPTKRHDDLLSPFGTIWCEPLLLDAPPLAIEAKLPRPIQVQPIVPLDRSTLPIRTWILGSGEKKLTRREH